MESSKNLGFGFYARNGKWDRSRGIGSIEDDSIEHKETFVDSKGRIKYSFVKTRVGTIRQNIGRGILEKIGKRIQKMTLKGHSNHYNVKFLKGYGLFISVKDSK